MKTQTKLEKVTGKTLTGFAESYIEGQIILIFGDEFVCLGVDRGYESGDERVVEDNLDWLGFGHDTLIDKGLITEDELTSMKANKHAVFKAKQEARDLITYNNLRVKFEGKQP